MSPRDAWIAREHRVQRRRSALRMLGEMAFVLTPLITLGFATPITFLAAAILFRYLGRATALMLWGATAGYLAALVVEVATVNASGGSFGAVACAVCIVITWPLGGIHAIAFRIWVACQHRPRRSPADSATVQAPWRSLQLGSRVVALAFSPDSHLLTVGCRRHVGVCNLNGASVSDSSITMAGWPSAVALSRDGKHCARAAWLRPQVTIYDLTAGTKRILDCRAPGRWSRVTAMAFSPDTTRLVTATATGFVTVQDLLIGTPTFTVRHAKWRVTATSYSPDGRLLATGGSDGMIRTWDSRTGVPRLTIQHPDSPIAMDESGGSAPPPIRTLAFSPGSAMLAAGSHETVVLWPVAAVPGTPTFRTRPARAGHGPAAVAFSPDTRLLAAAHRRGTARLWDLRTSEPARVLRHTSGWTCRLTALSFTPDGTMLAAGTSDGAVHLWKLT